MDKSFALTSEDIALVKGIISQTDFSITSKCITGGSK